MKLTKDYIINHIQQTKYPCWSLYVMQQYGKRYPIMHYNGDDFSENDDATVKAEKAVARLSGALQMLPSDALLCIELRSSKGANGSQGTLGPFEFYNRDKGDEAPALATIGAQATPANFGGFGFAPPPGWVSEEMLAGKLEALKVENENRVNEILFNQKKREFSEWAKRERAEIAEIKKELRDEKRKYESNTGAAAETLVFAMKKLIAELFPGSPVVGALTGAPEAAPNNDPGVMNGTDSDNTDEENTPKFKAVEGLAAMLYNDDRVTEADVEKIQALIETQLQKNAQASGQEAAQQDAA